MCVSSSTSALSALAGVVMHYRILEEASMGMLGLVMGVLERIEGLYEHYQRLLVVDLKPLPSCKRYWCLFSLTWKSVKGQRTLRLSESSDSSCLYQLPHQRQRPLSRSLNVAIRIDTARLHFLALISPPALRYDGRQRQQQGPDQVRQFRYQQGVRPHRWQRLQ